MSDEQRMRHTATEKLLVIKKAAEKTPKSLRWIHSKDDSFSMTRCSSVGLSEAIYENMGWETGFKYRILGTAVEVDGEDILVFALDDYKMIVPAKLGTVVSIDTSKLSPQEAREMMKNGTIPANECVPDLDVPTMEDVQRTIDQLASEARIS